MTRQLLWLSCIAVALVAAAEVAAGLWFVPEASRSSFVALGIVLGLVGVVLAGLLALKAGDRLRQPLQQITRAIEADTAGREPLSRFVPRVPEEVAPLLSLIARTQERLRGTVAELERDGEQMAAIFQHMADGLIVADGEERIVLSNAAVPRLLRRRPRIGRRLAESVTDAEILEIARAAVAQPQHPVATLVDLPGTGGAARRWLQVVATYLPRERRTVLLLHDVTELRQAEAARRDFVANVSHELRTPIAALKALVETLEDGAIDDPQAAPEFLGRIHGEVDRLTQLVADLLELARVEAGRLELDLRPVSAEVLLDEAIDRLRAYAARLDLRIAHADVPPCEESVLADERRIGQVLSNLLANAVKFTPPGGRVELGARADHGVVEFWVTDTGVGIPAESLSRVFERFYKLDPSRSSAGTGLGLAIAKHMVRAHGGDVSAESDGPGTGATFRFTLPRAQTVETRSDPSERGPAHVPSATLLQA